MVIVTATVVFFGANIFREYQAQKVSNDITRGYDVVANRMDLLLHIVVAKCELLYDCLLFAGKSKQKWKSVLNGVQVALSLEIIVTALLFYYRFTLTVEYRLFGLTLLWFLLRSAYLVVHAPCKITNRQQVHYAPSETATASEERCRERINMFRRYCHTLKPGPSKISHRISDGKQKALNH